jgi:hypothetical protein
LFHASLQGVQAGYIAIYIEVDMKRVSRKHIDQRLFYLSKEEL